MLMVCGAGVLRVSYSADRSARGCTDRRTRRSGHNRACASADRCTCSGISAASGNQGRHGDKRNAYEYKSFHVLTSVLRVVSRASAYLMAGTTGETSAGR